jgi:hypothetical protein
LRSILTPLIVLQRTILGEWLADAALLQAFEERLALTRSGMAVLLMKPGGPISRQLVTEWFEDEAALAALEEKLAQHRKGSVIGGGSLRARLAEAKKIAKFAAKGLLPHAFVEGLEPVQDLRTVRPRKLLERAGKYVVPHAVFKLLKAGGPEEPQR